METVYTIKHVASGKFITVPRRYLGFSLQASALNAPTFASMTLAAAYAHGGGLDPAAYRVVPIAGGK